MTTQPAAADQRRTVPHGTVPNREEGGQDGAPASSAAQAPPTSAPAPATRRAPSLVLVATGDGKGKTTAAMGTVLRASSAPGRYVSSSS